MTANVWGAGRLFKELAYIYPEDSHVILAEVKNQVGYGKRERFADALVVSLWPSRGLELIGCEFKSSRSDLLTELKNPAKAEEIQRFCDRWYLVLGDKELIKEGELPETWGLIAPKRSRLGIIKKAPKLSRQDWPTGFVFSMIRAASKRFKADKRDYKAALRKEILDEISERDASSGEYWKQRYLKLEDDIREFENASGIHPFEGVRYKAKALGDFYRYLNSTQWEKVGGELLLVAEKLEFAASRAEGYRKMAAELESLRKEHLKFQEFCKKPKRSKVKFRKKPTS